MRDGQRRSLRTATMSNALLERLSLPMDVLGRVLLGLYFLIPGITKITGFNTMAAYMAQHGVPFTVPLLVLTIPIQIGCGLALIAGWRTRPAAFILAGLTLLISVYMHDFWNSYEGGNQQHELQNFIKNLGIFAGLLILAARGSPRASMDARR
jgi:putative oxidoreductase